MARKISFKQSLFLVLIFHLVFFAKAQNPLPIKEEFDRYSYLRIFQNPNPNDNYDPCGILPNNDWKAYGDGMSFVLDSYITMYKATGDKAYLYKFVIHSLCMMENRHDFAGINSEPRWSELMYHDGYIIGAMARLVYFIKIEKPSLQSVNIYPFPEITGNSFGLTFNTFDDYVNWLKDRLNESLIWFHTNGYWDDNIGYKSDLNSSRPAAINMQVGFGRALLFMGLTENSAFYLSKAQIMSNLFKSNISFYDPCEDVVYDEPVFRVNSDNSYWWYHKSWSVERQNCWTSTFPFYRQGVPDLNLFTEFKEDISHGAIVSFLPMDYFNFQPSTPFNSTDLVRFRNMFTKNIYDGNGGFFEAVDGTNGPITNPGNLDISALNYMQFENYDGYDNTATTPNVYDIVMDFYEDNIYNRTGIPSSYGGQAIQGHAETVKAQWEKECVNLTLYNRTIVYDQDFIVKNKIIVAPEQVDYLHQLNDQSYAEPITTDNSFVIEPGTTVNMVAGESIELLPGFHAKAGSNFHASINPSACTDGQRTAPPNSFNTSNNSSNVSSSASETGLQNQKRLQDSLDSRNKNILEKFYLFPNPTLNKFYAVFTISKNAKATLQLTDMLGQELITELNNGTIASGNYIIPFDCSSLAKGLYLCNFIENGRIIATKKIVLAE